MLAIAGLDLLQISRNRGQLVGIVVLPLLLTFVFGMAFGGKAATTVKVAFADADGSARSRQVGALLAGNAGLSVETASEAAARSLVADHKVAAAVVVPKGFGAGIKALCTARPGTVVPPLEVLSDAQSPQQGMAVGEIARGIGARMAADAFAARRASASVAEVRKAFLDEPLVMSVGDVRRSQAEYGLRVRDYPPQARKAMAARFPYLAGGPSLGSLYATADARWEPKPPVAVSAAAVTPSNVRGSSTLAEGATQYSMGFVVMFVMMIAMSSAGGILEEREFGTLRRLLTTPVSRGALLGGKILGVLLTAALEAGILIGLSAALFRVPWGSDPVALLAVLAAYILAATGLGVLTSALVRTRGQLAAISAVGATTLAMLGGCYWPIDIVSAPMRTIATLTPTGWAMRGLTDVVVRHQGLGAVAMPALVLLVFAAAAFGAGVRLTRFE